MIHAIRVVVEELGIRTLVGVALTWLTTLMLRFAERQGWISEHWEEVPIVALAAACFAVAQATGGSGFIACFVGGLLLSGLRQRHKEELLRGAVATGEALALLTWIAFGIGALAPIVARLTWPALLYAVLSLSLIRMGPVFLCLAGSGMRAADKLFIAWFGPRGLATIVFGVIILNEKLPGNDTIIAVAGGTVLLSVIAHGVTANPLVKSMVGRSSEKSPAVNDS
jgi:NhaP-type Na+/H+ or K+/H+ antiporter